MPFNETALPEHSANVTDLLSGTALYLASDTSSFSTGDTIVVDGGVN